MQELGRLNQDAIVYFADPTFSGYGTELSHHHIELYGRDIVILYDPAAGRDWD